jgi:hypothetical protein
MTNKAPINGWSGSFTIKGKLKPDSMERLIEVCKSAPAAKAALTCLACGTAEGYHGHPSVQEAMVQIEDFKRAHVGCRKGR